MKKVFIIYMVVLVIALLVAFVSDNNIKKANTSVAQSFPSVIVDAGHGGFDGGAVCGDIIEKDINLEFALKAEQFLKVLGYDVIMTRTTDTGTEDSGLGTIRSKKISDIKNRLNLVENTNIEFFLSLHQNMYSQSIYKGTQVFYGPNNDKSPELAENIQNSVHSLLQQDNNRVKKPCGKNIYLMYHITKPAVMVECGFMSNKQELNNLMNSQYQSKLIFSIVMGLIKGR